jgi:NADPH-dependent 2,4-dienoyl-CoA reductase/sulfur reductase-like enzyme
MVVADRNRYYPGAVDLVLRMTGDARTGRILGAQIVGGLDGQVAKRIDIVAAAVHHGMTMEGLSDLDLSYTPPFSSPWDPVQAAAQAWIRAAESR